MVVDDDYWDKKDKSIKNNKIESPKKSFLNKFIGKSASNLFIVSALNNFGFGAFPENQPPNDGNGNNGGGGNWEPRGDDSDDESPKVSYMFIASLTLLGLNLFRDIVKGISSA